MIRRTFLRVQRSLQHIEQYHRPGNNICSLLKHEAGPKHNFSSTYFLNTSSSSFNKHQQPTTMADEEWKNKKTIYEFTVKDIDGNEVSLEKYKGHPTIIVNVATKCGLTDSNYKQLNELYEKYKDDGLRIACYPCNQFAGEEPGCDVDIKEFAQKKNFHFDFYSKVDVNGDNAIPLYKWLKKEQGGILGFDSIKWNFSKFLINKEGKPIKRYASTTEPKSMEPDIKALL